MGSCSISISCQFKEIFIESGVDYLQFYPLYSFKLCAECAGIEGDGSSEKIFNSLIFVIRDWQLDDNTGEQKGEFEKRVSKVNDIKIMFV